jgi:guanylate kinase
MTRGLLLIISGPSGVGKTTITRAVERHFAAPHPAAAVFSVSATTRPKTDADREGVDYHFVSDEEFDRLIAEGAFLEYAGVFGKRYGTLRKWVEERLAEGRLVILEIDVQGAINVKRQMPDALGIFVLPPSEDVLLERLRARKREPEEVIQRRFAEAKREIATARTCGAYDAFIVNDALDDAVAEAIRVVESHLGGATDGRRSTQI